MEWGSRKIERQNDTMENQTVPCSKSGLFFTVYFFVCLFFFISSLPPPTVKVFHILEIVSFFNVLLYHQLWISISVNDQSGVHMSINVFVEIKHKFLFGLSLKLSIHC